MARTIESIAGNEGILQCIVRPIWSGKTDIEKCIAIEKKLGEKVGR